MQTTVSLEVNGQTRSAQVEARTQLADFLREECHLSGTHLGCEHGVCGACTILMDGAPARSCIAYAATCQGSQIQTIEGLQDEPLMARLREAFSRHHALQCGFCTPGMLISAYDIVRRLPTADEARIREELSGNLCRCTGYVGIVNAIKEVLANLPDDLELVTPVQQTITEQATTDQLPHAIETTNVTDVRHHNHANAGTVLAKQLTLDMPVAQLWPVLRDVQLIARCLPGAELTGAVDTQPMPFKFNVALGPMRAAFVGEARVDYDDEHHNGQLEGQGHDQSNRSEASGKIDFRVSELPQNRSQLDLSIRYALTGSLAQFSRGGIVNNVVEQLLTQFAENLTAAAVGKNVSDERQLSGFSLVMATLLKRWRSWFIKS